MKDWLWYLFGNYVQHAKKYVLIFASPFIYFQYFCTESLEPDPCCSHAKLLCSLGPVPLTSVMTFPALLDPSLIFLSPIYLEQKHLLHIALLNGTDRIWWMHFVYGKQEEERTYTYFIILSICTPTVFAIADSMGHRKLWITAEGSSVLKSFGQKKRLHLSSLTDWLTWWECEARDKLNFRTFTGPWLI